MATAASPLGSLATPAGAPGLATEPVSGNSLDQFIRSIEGLSGTQGQGILGSGLNLLQSGQPLVGTGKGIAQQGITSAGQSAAAAAPALDVLTKLVRGDQGDLAQATQPETDAITQQFDQIRNLVSMQPRGGGKASVLAETPFKRATAIQQMQGQARTAATTALPQVAAQLANIGLSQGQLGLGIGQLGLGQESAGLGLAGLGSNLETEAANIALNKQGLDYSQPSALAQIEGAVNTFI